MSSGQTRYAIRIENPNINIRGRKAMLHPSRGETMYSTNRSHDERSHSRPRAPISRDQQRSTGFGNYNNGGESGSGYHFQVQESRGRKRRYAEVDDEQQDEEFYDNDVDAQMGYEQQSGRTQFRAPPAQMGLDNNRGQNQTLIIYDRADQEPQEQSRFPPNLFPNPSETPNNPRRRTNNFGFLSPLNEHTPPSPSTFGPMPDSASENRTMNAPSKNQLRNLASVMNVSSIVNKSQPQAVDNTFVGRDNTNSRQDNTQTQSRATTKRQRQTQQLSEEFIMEEDDNTYAQATSSRRVSGHNMGSSSKQPDAEYQDYELPARHGLPQRRQDSSSPTPRPREVTEDAASPPPPSSKKRKARKSKKAEVAPEPMKEVVVLEDLVTYASAHFKGADAEKIQITVKRGRVKNAVNFTEFLNEYRASRFGLDEEQYAQEAYVVSRQKIEDSVAAVNERNELLEERAARIALQEEQLRQLHSQLTRLSEEKKLWVESQRKNSGVSGVQSKGKGMESEVEADGEAQDAVMDNSDDMIGVVNGAELGMENGMDDGMDSGMDSPI